jgi:uncharacterized protein
MQETASIAPGNLPNLLGQLASLKETVRSRYKAQLLGVFGSYARKEQKQGSDIDILVHFESGATLFDVVELEYFLLEELGIKPDIVSDKRLKPRLKPFILKDLIKI